MRFTHNSGILQLLAAIPKPFDFEDRGAQPYHLNGCSSVTAQILWQMLPLDSNGLSNSSLVSPLTITGNLLPLEINDQNYNDWLTHKEVDETQCDSSNCVNYKVVTSFNINGIRN